MGGNRLLVYVLFPIPVDANVAFAANYEVKRISKCSTDRCAYEFMSIDEMLQIVTDDEEINLYGSIDKKGKVVKKFTLKR